ncbi:hypothetical protein [Streptosporangium pseudovulgare]|uniref:Uncharacterized protein n=1 Tax=Streptosporangium pseudovulgare TaxID=35765 RepID=A0ABQ2RBM3_9ACTN|nr:hypothetical protein [Streptosporangium pseudovulgare]GGQ23673.1 hypothetical protein GCM10010140_62440 [Streptosporangium pseudovulgare]
MNLAIALDDLAHHPDLAEILNTTRTAIRAAGYSWILDQADAAARDTCNTLTTAAAATGSTPLSLPLDQHPDWVRLGLLDALAAWITEQATTCLHQPHPARPQPVISAAWRPRLVVCSACAHLLRLPKGSAKDRTCDGCGQVVPDHGAIWSAAASHGGFVYQYGVCEPCRYWPTTPATA